jgi:hypothetical protein
MAPMTYEQLRTLQREQELHRDEWIKNYPNFCQKCGASGQISWEENYGIPGPTETLTDICDSCLGSDKCPRCGETFSDESLRLAEHEHLYCPDCEWTAANPDMVPYVLELYGDSDDEDDPR